MVEVDVAFGVDVVLAVAVVFAVDVVLADDVSFDVAVVLEEVVTSVFVFVLVVDESNLVVVIVVVLKVNVEEFFVPNVSGRIMANRIANDKKMQIIIIIYDFGQHGMHFSSAVSSK